MLFRSIRNFIKTISITEKIIKKSNITLDILRQTDIKLNETIQNIKRNEIKNKICTEYNNIENVIGIGYVHSNNDVVLYNPENIILTEEEKTDIQNKLKGNITIITSDNFISNEIHPDISDINLSINNNVYVHFYKNIASFCLQRLKVNFVTIFNNSDGISKIIKPYSGELIDIVIFKKESTALNYFYQNHPLVLILVLQ